MIIKNHETHRLLASADFFYTKIEEIIVLKYHNETYSKIRWANGHEQWVENSSVNVLEDLGRSTLFDPVPDGRFD